MKDLNRCQRHWLKNNTKNKKNKIKTGYATLGDAPKLSCMFNGFGLVAECVY